MPFLFFCIYWDDHMAFVFLLFNMAYHIIWFACIEPFCDPEMHSIWFWSMIIFIYYWICFDTISLMDFWSIFTKDIGLHFFSFCSVFLWFLFHGCCSLLKWTCECYLFNFFEQFEKNGHEFFVYSLFSPGLFLLLFFLSFFFFFCIDAISFLVIGILSGYMFVETCPFLPCSPIC